MENGKRKTENERAELNREKFSVFQSSFPVEKSCSACGTAATRRFAKFCRVCGKLLREDYEPLDALRASYNLQRRQIGFEPKARQNSENLFEKNENPASETAWAFAVYALVPYLGILFCPGAILIGGIGVFTAYRKPYLGGRKISLASIFLGVIVFVTQIFLWWLLYIIPELNK
ncbi:MAG: hypothetical protein ACR2GD_07900 [Pyrinomonadaceae bacterium]